MHLLTLVKIKKGLLLYNKVPFCVILAEDMFLMIILFFNYLSKYVLVNVRTSLQISKFHTVYLINLYVSLDATREKNSSKYATISFNTLGRALVCESKGPMLWIWVTEIYDQMLLNSLRSIKTHCDLWKPTCKLTTYQIWSKFFVLLIPNYWYLTKCFNLLLYRMRKENIGTWIMPWQFLGPF